MRAMSRSMEFVAAVVVFFAAARGVQAQCSWLTVPTTIDFGRYSVFGGNSNTTTTTGSVRCTGSLDVTVSSTTGGSGTYNPRKMNTTALYNVYIDAGRTLVWGDGTVGTSQYTFSNTGGPKAVVNY